MREGECESHSGYKNGLTQEVTKSEALLLLDYLLTTAKKASSKGMIF